jgi:hypothetical protein
VGNTPLADSVCLALEQLRGAALAGSQAKKILTLESDAGENWSAFACKGASSPDPGFNHFQNGKDGTTFKVDWGWQPGWQLNLTRRAVFLAANPSFAQEANAVATQITNASQGLPADMAIRIDAHYAMCSPTDTLAPCPTTSALTVIGPDGTVSNPSEPALRSASLAPGFRTLAAATATGMTPTILPAELSFMHAMGSINAKSGFRAITRDSSVVFGVTHKLAGDVDDSGCVDKADFSIVTQKDVWMQRAVQPLQIAIRADLNRDGWVNELDRAIVLANWGKGCINNPGPKPKI